LVSRPLTFVTFTPMSGTVRQQKFNRLIQKELSEIFQRDRRGILENAFLTVTEVRVSPDLSVAKVYLSMTLAKDKNSLLDKINLRKKEIRKALGDKMRNQARIIPHLVFFIDEIDESATKMDALIDSLKIPPLKEGETPGEE